jgi:hypothetical protein
LPSDFQTRRSCGGAGELLWEEDVMARTRDAFWAMVICVCSVTGLAGSSDATVIWNESVNGNLSASQSSPTPLTLSDGTNSIIGTVGTGKTADWVALTIPSGFQLTEVVLAAYASTDQQGFTGFQPGSSFVGNAETTASAYEGYAHYGTNSTNGSLPPANLVGVNILPIMANPSADPGATGFTPPVASGTYTFLIQQLGATTNFQFDYDVTPVPEPASVAVLGMGVCGLCLRRRPK